MALPGSTDATIIIAQNGPTPADRRHGHDPGRNCNDSRFHFDLLRQLPRSFSVYEGASGTLNGYYALGVANPCVRRRTFVTICFPAGQRNNRLQNSRPGG